MPWSLIRIHLNGRWWSCLGWTQWFKGYFRDLLERDDLAKWAKEDGGGKSARVAVGAKGWSFLGTVAPFLVVATTPSLTIILADLVTLNSGYFFPHSISLHPLGEGRSDAQILSCFLTFSISPINLANVLYHTKRIHHLITPSNDTGVSFLYGGTQDTLN